MPILTAGKRRGERGQAIILLVGVITVVFVIAAIVIDFGLWLSERRGAQRVADLAATAGAQDLLQTGQTAFSNDSAAIASALEWAGYNDVDEGVDVQLLCSNTLPVGTEGICDNVNQPGFSACSVGDGCDALRVTISRPGAHLFTSIFNIQATVGAGAIAGVTLELEGGMQDTVIAIGATGSMAYDATSYCNATQSNAGCPIKEARDAASAVVDLLAGGTSQVGYVPYSHCFDPPISLSGCVPVANVIGLTTDSSALYTAIDATFVPPDTAQSNICLGLLRAQQLFNGPGAQAGAQRALILLSDGNNNYNDIVNDVQSSYPPTACRPDDPTRSVPVTDCTSPWYQDQDLDWLTWQLAQQLKNSGVEIYVVGYDVCPLLSFQTPSENCNAIGNHEHDGISDRRLLKCIASSPDHYFEEASAADLAATFQEIAAEIGVGSRQSGLLQ